MIHRDEIMISNTTGDHFAIIDTDGDTVLEIPKRIAPTEDDVIRLLDWLVPVLRGTHSKAFVAGETAGTAQMQHAIRALIGVPSMESVDQLWNRLGEGEA